MRYCKFLCLCAFLVLSFGASAQNKSNNKDVFLSGQVLNELKAPMAGVSVVILGKNTGTITDQNGRFNLAVQSGDQVTFSFSGYKPVKLNVTQTSSSIEINMQKSESELDEVVVVGYGTQTRRDVVSSVGQISGEELQNRPNSNIVQSLQGKMTGVNIVMRDGKPWRGPTPTIRGVVNSIGSGGSALVLIDGVEGDLTTVSPDDVENVSVLKDATAAAIYGSRGAFGVILITTKSGRSGKAKINFNADYGINVRTTKLEDEIVDNGLQWTNSFLSFYGGAFDYLINPAGINNAFPISDAWYEELKKHDANPDLPKVALSDDGIWQYYGNTNWADIFYKDNNASHSYSISASGGGAHSRFYVSARQFQQDDIYNAGNGDYHASNINLKGEIDISPFAKVSNSTRLYIRKYRQPMLFYGRQLPQRQWDQEGFPVTVPMNPDGTWSEAGVYVGWRAFTEGTSYQDNDKFDMTNTTTLTIAPIKDVLTINADFTYYFNNSSRFRVENMYEFNTGLNVTGVRQNYSSIENWGYNNNYINSNVSANWTPKLGDDHVFSLVAGWNLEDHNSNNIKTYRQGILYPRQASFALMDGEYYAADQTGDTWGTVGGFFRAHYKYKNRYLAEVSGRYDGSSKFPSNQRFGFFPSVSAGWIISEESFMAKSRSWLNNLKIRGSAGTLGNGQVASFSYMSTMGISKSSVLIDGTNQSYTSAPSIVPTGLTWEKVTTYDIGLDANMFNNRVGVIFDYYQRSTNDMYTVGPTLPQVLGNAAPKGNNADLKTNGWELSLSYNNSVKVGGKDLTFKITGNLWDSRSYVTEFYNENGNINTYAQVVKTNYYKGMEVGEIWGFTVLGLFKDDDEAAHWADQSFFNNSSNRIPLAGDLKFSDLDTSGKIDRGTQTLADHGDLTIIGNTSPRYRYGGNINLSWNNIDLGVFLQGVGKQDWYPSAESGVFWGQFNRPYGLLPKVMTGDNIWTEENQNVNAYWPRARGYLANRNEGPMTLPNTRYLQNVSYMRIKNLTVGYTLPNKLTKRFFVENLRVYFSGDNLFTFSPIYKHIKIFDPEVIYEGDADFSHTMGSGETADGYSYPMLKKFTLGINISL